MVSIEEIKRRIAILEKEKPIVINKRMLRGGMDNRNRNRSIDKYNTDIKSNLNKHKNALSLMETPSSPEMSLFGISSIPLSQTLNVEETFVKPKLNKTRIGGKGWF